MAPIVIYRPARPRKKANAAAITGAAIVAVTSEKRAKVLRAERRAADSEVNPEVEAFFARNVRPGSPLAPKRS